MTTTLALTINNRDPETTRKVAESLKTPGNQADQVVIVLDRPTPEARSAAIEAYGAFKNAIFPEIEGDPGWICPAKAWNTALEATSGDLMVMISSDVVQGPDNLATLGDLALPNTAVFGKCECSCGPSGNEVNWGGTAPGNLLVDAAHPRPLGFIVAVPTASLRAIGGWDEAFMKGLWYEDDDIFRRLWASGVNFSFSDRVYGVHQHHERPHLDQSRIAVNQAIFASKYPPVYGSAPFPGKMLLYTPGLTHWKHLAP